MDASTKHETRGATGCLSASAQRGGFTLVELLTVIVIIGILAGLITAAAVPAIRAARRATIQTEIGQLNLALDDYKIKFGDYPPDFAGVNDSDTASNGIRDTARNQVLRHLRKRFPRLRLGTSALSPWEHFRLLVKQASLKDSSLADPNAANATDVNSLDPSTALTFWLGGPAEGGTNTLVGFSANPANPFAIGGSRASEMYEFDETRLANTGSGTGNSVRFIPPNMPATPTAGSTKAPYVYFRPRNSQYDPVIASFPQRTESSIESCTCVPYAIEDMPVSGNPRWFSPKKYQIICAGLDGYFSDNTDRVINPDGDLANKYRCLDMNSANYYISPAEDDNITSFTQGKLEDRPEE